MRPQLLMICAALTACAVGPDYVRPDAAIPAAFKEWQPAAPQAVAADTRWWRVLDDAVLDQLEEQLGRGNQNLKLAEARYRAARATLDSARAGFSPTVDLTAARTRSEVARQGVATQYALTASLSWELDVWGRVRRAVEGADAKLAAAAADLAAAQLSAQALLAQTYVQLRALDMQNALLKKSLADAARFLQITRNRLSSGVASPLDVAQAETQLSSAETQALEYQNQRAQLEHAIALLIGQPPAAFNLAAGELPRTLPDAPALLPSTVLQRRPDIASAERLMAAANAQIGVATSAWFPQLDLSASVGVKNNALADLISVPNRVWSLGPSLALSLIDGGARSAAVAQAGAAFEQAVATYRQTVLAAFGEVEDNLAAAHFLAQEAATQSRALGAATRSREIAENQYKAGIVGFLNVVTAQTAEQTATLNAVAITSRRWQALIQLYKNAGGPVAGKGA